MVLSVTGTRAPTEHPPAVAKDPQTKQYLADQKRLLTAARRSGNRHDHLPLIVLVALLREEDGEMSVMMSRKCTSAYQPGLGGPLRVRLQGALQGVHDAPAFPRLGASRTAGGPRVARRKLGCKEAARRVAGTPEHAGHDRGARESRKPEHPGDFYRNIRAGTSANPEIDTGGRVRGRRQRARGPVRGPRDSGGRRAWRGHRASVRRRAAVPEAASASNRATAVCDDDDDPLGSGEPGASACSSRRKSGYFSSN